MTKKCKGILAHIVTRVADIIGYNITVIENRTVVGHRFAQKWILLMNITVKDLATKVRFIYMANYFVI